MLTDEDVKKLIEANREVFATKEDLEVFASRKELLEIFATREEVVTKQDFEDLRKDFSNLQTSVDAYAKKADTYFQEMVMLARKVDRHEKWISQIAEKLGIKLEN